MKIALVLERFEPRGGGLERWSWQLAHVLAGRGHNITVIAFFAAENRPSENVALRQLPWHESRLARARAVELAVRGLDADVIHDFGVGWSADIFHPQMGSRAASYERESRSFNWMTRVWRIVDPTQRKWIDEVRQLERRQYASGDCAVVAVSQLVARDLERMYGVEAARIRLIPNGVDAGPFQAIDSHVRERVRADLGLGTGTVFLFAAHNPRLKGLGPLLRALPAVLATRPEVRLMTIGGDLPRAFGRLLRSDEVRRAVVFVGSVADPRPYFAAADAFVLPSFHDACSLSVIEACASGLPVVTTRQNGSSDLLTDGLDGRVIDDPTDVRALSAALLELADPVRRASMRPHALETASRSTFGRNVDALEHLYRDIVAGRRPLDGRRRA